jgi:Zn-dependent M28 family amino/carboxypeptidase
MWYSAEEFGLLGSAAYVAGLSQAEKDRIAAMINFDMIGSPNYVRGVYDGDNSAFAPSGTTVLDGPPGSGEIERIFRDYFPQVGLVSAETPFSGRSDYGPFLAQGIPTGGLFTGAESIKTPAEVAVYGGTAGEQYDECYHLACDTLANVNLQGLSEMSDAAAHATMVLAYRKFDKYPLVDPATPVSGTDGLPSHGMSNGHSDDAAQ